MGARWSFITLLVLTATACTVQETGAPPLTGPSELALRIKLDASPDSILQDGLSQSSIQIEAINGDGRPARGLPLRMDVVFDGTIQDFGTLSSKTVVTGDDGRARVTYTAPPRSSQSTDPFNVITIRATPIGTDFRGEIARTVDVRLIPPGVILPPNAAPQALFTFTPSAPDVLTNVVFDASTSTDEAVMCGVGCTYTWEFGDGSTGTGIFASHQYLTPGTFQVRLTVTDARGASASIAQPITIGAGVAPTAAFTFSPTNPAVSQTIFFAAEGSRAAPGRQIVSYDWNFGSGATGSGLTTSKSYSTPGTYTVTLTVTDNAGAQGTVTQSVTVGAPGTGLQAALTVSPTGGTTATTFFFDASPSHGPSPIVEYRFTFGDGSADVVGVSPTTTHKYATAGTYTARVTVRDSANRTATITAPVAVQP
jgi:PKD repeat protein